MRSSYPGSSRKTLRSLKRQRAGRISELTGDKNIPTYVLPLRGRYTSHSAQRKFMHRKSKNFGTPIEICSQSLHFFNKNALKYFLLKSILNITTINFVLEIFLTSISFPRNVLKLHYHFQSKNFIILIYHMFLDMYDL